MTRPPDIAGWMHSGLTVRPSQIDRAGLFTTVSLGVSEPVIRFGGFLFASAARYDNALIAEGSVVGVAEDVLLAEPSDLAKDRSDYINHSCFPNLGLSDALTLVTTRDVAPGEELTADYAFWETDESYVMKRLCNCGTERCRRTITGLDWNQPDLRPYILAHAAPFIRRRVLSKNNSQTITRKV